MLGVRQASINKVFRNEYIERPTVYRRTLTYMYMWRRHLKTPPHLHERAELAEEGRQVPSVKEGRLELEGDAEYGDYDVSEGQVTDVQVDHRVHATPGCYKE